MRPELAARDVQIVALCTDTPTQIKKGRAKHGLRAIMLSDRQGTVIDALGIRNQGFHSGLPGGAKVLPIPTTVLTDAAGIVRWIDQSKDYQRRSDPERVRAALAEHLGAGDSERPVEA